MPPRPSAAERRRDDRSQAPAQPHGCSWGAPTTSYRVPGPRQHRPDRGQPQGRSSSRALHLDPGPAPARLKPSRKPEQKRSHQALDRPRSFRDDSATSHPDKPVTIVCDPLPGTPVQSNVTVNLQQANGRQVSSAQGTADTFSGAAAPFLTCDGVTQNTVVVQLTPNPGSGPFHGAG